MCRIGQGADWGVRSHQVTARALGRTGSKLGRHESSSKARVGFKRLEDSDRESKADESKHRQKDGVVPQVESVDEQGEPWQRR